MMLDNKNLKVALVSTHIPLSDVSKHITKEKLMAVLTTLNKDLENRFKIQSPRIAITGLNPHAGEGGEFGKEEKNIIYDYCIHFGWTWWFLKSIPFLRGDPCSLKNSEMFSWNYSTKSTS